MILGTEGGGGFKGLKRNLSHFIYRLACSFHNGTIKNLDWSNMKYISMFLFFKTVFSMQILCKGDSRISCFRNNVEIIRIEHFTIQKNDFNFHIIAQIKIQGYRCESGMLLFYMEGHLNLRRQSLQKLGANGEVRGVGPQRKIKGMRGGGTTANELFFRIRDIT